MKPQHMFLLLRAGDVEILKLPGKPDKDKEAPEPRVALENKDGGNIWKKLNTDTTASRIISRFR